MSITLRMGLSWRGVQKNRLRYVYVLALLLALLGALNPLILTRAFAATPVAYSGTKVIDTDGYIYVQGIATDSTGAVYQTGVYNGNATFDGSGGTDLQSSTNNSTFLTKYNANGTYAWTRIMDTSNSGNTSALAIATDKQDNIYITGQASGTVTFDGVGGSDTRTVANGAAFVTKYNASGAYDWTKVEDTSASNSYSNGTGINVDSSGNVYMSGSYGGTVVFDGAGGTDSQTTTNNTGYITKYNTNGTYVYTRSVDASNGYAQTNDVATDSNGDIYVLGNFTGTVVFDGISGSDSVTSANGSAYLTKYNADGSYGGTKVYDTSAANTYMYGTGLAVDVGGNVYVTGYFSGTVAFDPTDSLTSTNNTNTFLTKYTANGAYAGTKMFDTTNGGADAVKVTTDLLGDVFVLSGFTGTVVFDGASGSDSQTTSNGNGAITKYNANGAYAWTKVFDTTNGGAVQAQGAVGGIAVDKFGKVYVGSFFYGTVIFDGSNGTDSYTTGSLAGFLTSYTGFDPSDPAIASLAPVGSGQTTARTSPTVPNTGFDELSHGIIRLIITLFALLLGLGLLGTVLSLKKSRR